MAVINEPERLSDEKPFGHPADDAISQRKGLTVRDVEHRKFRNDRAFTGGDDAIRERLVFRRIDIANATAEHCDGAPLRGE